MCIAILNGPQETLAKQTLRNCWENNGDGAGILYIRDGVMKVFKEMKSFDNFYSNYIEIKRTNGNKHLVLHFRISTHGAVNETNCHPFLVDDNIGFVHNGMIYEMPYSNQFSDTYLFNENIMKSFNKGFENNEVVMDMLGDFIGNGNKLVFLNSKDEFFIVNEKAGLWDGASWYSNTSYQRVNTWVDYGGTRVERSSYRGNWWSAQAPKQNNIGFTPNTRYAAGVEKHKCLECDSPLYSTTEVEYDMCRSCLTTYGVIDDSLSTSSKMDSDKTFTDFL